MTYPAAWEMAPAGPVHAIVPVPGSKSITNRALVAAALADGETRLLGPGRSEDTLAMAGGLRDLGVGVTVGGRVWVVAGRGGRLVGPATVDAGGSGTTARFLTAVGALAGGGPVTVDGNAQLRRRPMAELADALTAAGAGVRWLGVEGMLPLEVEGPLHGGPVMIDASRSSQFVSALLLVAPYADADLVLHTPALVSRPYVESTLEVMNLFGAEAGWSGDEEITVAAGVPYRSRDFTVEPDASAAAYPWAAAAVTGGSVTVAGFPERSRQADLGFVDVLEQMGCRVVRRDGAVTVTGPARLRGVDVDMNAMPDAVLAAAVVALFADGPTTIRNIANLRLKESDRLAALESELTKLGAVIEVGPDSLTVRPGPTRSAEIDPHDDHRVAMALAVAGLRIPGVVIRHPECVAKTWPGFFDDMAAAVRPLVIAVDGPGGSGKSTVSAAAAHLLGLAHLETGGYYRAATLAALRAGADPASAADVAAAVADVEMSVEGQRVYLGEEDVTAALRSDEVTAAVSAVSAHPAVRTLMVDRQRSWVERHGGRAVVEGRDIGTVVFPDADLKVFLTARPEVRARRRTADLGADADPAAVGADLARRDHTDSSRTASPLRPADDAVVIDTSDLSQDEVVEVVVALVAGL